MTDLLSSRLSEQFSLNLPPAVIAWYDHGPWPELPITLFDQPVDPAALLNPSSAAIWGGQMLPDTLPFLSDGGGNSLCLRFGFDGSVSEVICWDHEGGNWKPYGKTLSEALLFDVAMALMGEDCHDDSLLIFADWALDWLPMPGLRELRDLSTDPAAFLTRLREFNLAQVAVHQFQCEKCFSNKLHQVCRKVGGGKLAKALGVDWRDFRKWLFDPEMIPAKYEQALSSLTAIPFPNLVYQDWEHAADEAQAVLNLRTDLTWPFTVLGRCEERKANAEVAISHYLKALETVKSSADFTAPWSILTGPASGFAAGRLMELLNCSTDQLIISDYLQALSTGNQAKAVRQYWIEKGERAERAAEYRTAYECYYKSGWDIPVSNEIEIVLDRLVRTARAAGSRALASLAERHRLAIA
jgi:tetratricopeptide (TPR) repeat protein